MELRSDTADFQGFYELKEKLFIQSKATVGNRYWKNPLYLFLWLFYAYLKPSTGLEVELLINKNINCFIAEQSV